MAVREFGHGSRCLLSRRSVPIARYLRLRLSWSLGGRTVRQNSFHNQCNALELDHRERVRSNGFKSPVVIAPKDA